MHAFDVLGDPIRRRILELLAGSGTVTAGEITATVMAEFGVSQPAVSRHLRVLRESGFASCRAEGTRRLYALDSAGITEAQEWLDGVQRFWSNAMSALHTEVARQNRARRP